MATIEEMRARAKEARDRAAAVKLSDEDAEMARLIEEEADALAEARASIAAKRKVDLRAKEDAARANAKGGYHVRGLDLAAFAPPECNVDDLPGAGLLVVRSASTEIERKKNADIEARERSVDAIFADYACGVTVDPSQDGESGVMFRRFVDDARNAGLVTQIVTVAHELIGLKQREAKRGR